MQKTIIRSYTTGKEGDLIVTKFEKDGKRVDLSKNYEDLPRNRRAIQPDSYVDVFRYEDGDLTWSGSPNGNHANSAASFRLLLEALVQDMAAPDGTPRSF